MMKMASLMFAVGAAMLQRAVSQDYDVADITCSFGIRSKVDGAQDAIEVEPEGLTALLRKPEGFTGSPIFADDRKLDPRTDPYCRIRPDPGDKEGLIYTLHVKDLGKCGVLTKNGFINLRIWFPKLSGVVMMSDQEVIIMCKPPEPVVTSRKAASYAGKLPPAARVSGVVEESPGNLEYEVALYRESSNSGSKGGAVAVDQAVPIGTKLQLRAAIGTNSAWKHIKLMEVTISPDPENADAKGHIKLIDNGCRVEEFYAILPKQPYRPEGTTNEVRMEFEAVLLDAQRDRDDYGLHQI